MNNGYSQPRRRTQSARLTQQETSAAPLQQAAAYQRPRQGVPTTSGASNYTPQNSFRQQGNPVATRQQVNQPVQQMPQPQARQTYQPTQTANQPNSQPGFQTSYQQTPAQPQQRPAYAGQAVQSQPVYYQQPVYQPQQPSYGVERQGKQQNYQHTTGYIPPKRPDPPMSNGGEPPQKRGNNWIVILVAAVLVIAIGVGAYYYHQDAQLRSAVTAFDNVFCPGVFVDGIALEGMTAEEGVAAVTAQAQTRNDSWYVNLTYQGQVVTTLTASQLGMTVDVADVMNQAWAQGHTGDVYQRKDAMEQLLVTPFEGYTAMPGGDTSVVDGVLNEIKNLVYRAPTDATLVSFDPDKTDPFTFQDAVEGRTLDIEPLKEKLYQMVSTMESGDVEIEPDTIAPTVTLEELKKKYTLRASVYTPISSKSSENRTNNIRRCFELISGYVLDSGSKFSFNTVVGKRTVANGFYEAIEYAYGTEVMGVGGGTCQASTTLYQAAVEAGLDIITREPHSKSVSYAAYGEDATVYWEGNRKIDLVFKNSTDSPLYFVASVQSDPSNRKRLIAKVSIYGESLGDDVRYELQSQTVEILTAPEDPEYVKDTKQTYVTYTDEEYVARKAADGCKVESYRVKYVGDTAVERTLLFTDTYKAQSKLIYVGTKKRTE